MGCGRRKIAYVHGRRYGEEITVFEQFANARRLSARVARVYRAAVLVDAIGPPRSMPSARRLAILGTVLAALSFLGAAMPPHGEMRLESYHIDSLADGVFAVVRHDPIAYANNANSLIVLGDSGVLVVDAQFTRAATLETIGAIRRLSTKPVRYVVNTHWHDDHVAGNQVYRDTFPTVEFISHQNTRQDLATIGAANRRATWNAAPAFIQRLNRLLSENRGIDSLPVVPLERVALESSAAIAGQYLADRAQFRETLADVTFSRRMTLMLSPARRVELCWFGEANTRGDAVVHVPDAKVVATGDLVVAPVPFAFNAHVGGWINALDSVAALGPATLVPGHGPVMRDLEYLRRLRAMLRRIREEAQRVAAAGGGAGAARTIRLDEYRRTVAGDDHWLNFLFQNFFLAPAIASAYAEAVAQRAMP